MPVPCSVYAECTNTDGGHTCECKNGYVGNGFRCEGNCRYFPTLILIFRLICFCRFNFLLCFPPKIPTEKWGILTETSINIIGYTTKGGWRGVRN